MTRLLPTLDPRDPTTHRRAGLTSSQPAHPGRAEALRGILTTACPDHPRTRTRTRHTVYAVRHNGHGTGQQDSSSAHASPLMRASTGPATSVSIPSASIDPVRRKDMLIGY